LPYESTNPDHGNEFGARFANLVNIAKPLSLNSTNRPMSRICQGEDDVPHLVDDAVQQGSLAARPAIV
jgi:hypothetical protein